MNRAAFDASDAAWKIALLSVLDCAALERRISVRRLPKDCGRIGDHQRSGFSLVTQGVPTAMTAKEPDTRVGRPPGVAGSANLPDGK